MLETNEFENLLLIKIFIVWDEQNISLELGVSPEGTEVHVLAGGMMWPDACLGCGESLG